MTRNDSESDNDNSDSNSDINENELKYQNVSQRLQRDRLEKQGKYVR